MELKEEDPPPFWLSSTAANRHRRRRHQAASSLFLNTGVFVVLLLFAAIVFLSIVIPSVLSLARQVFNPKLVKSSWNSLNLVLVIFAIVCGFLGRKDNDDQTPGNSPMRRDQAVKSTDSTPRQWYAYQDNSFGNVDSVRRLRRNSSSYPDLRLEGSSMVNENQWRFYDDTHVYNHQFVRSESRISRSRSLGVFDEDEIDVKCIEVDNACASSANDITPLTTPKKIADDKNIEMDTAQTDHKSEPAPVSPPAYLNQPLSPLSPPLSPSYFCPSPSPPPPAPPPPPPRKNRDAKRNDDPTKRASTSPPLYSKQPLSPPSPVSPTYFWPSPSPPPPPPPPPPPLQKKRNNSTNRESRSQQASFPQQPLSPSSPLSQMNYLWPPPSPPPPPPPPPAPLRTYSSILSKKKHENKNSPPKRESRSQVQIKVPPPPPPPPPPRTPPRSRTKVGQSSEDKKDKKGGGIVIRTLGRLPRRKRKQTRRSYENLSEFIEPPKVSIHRSKSTPEFPPSSPPKPIPAPPLSPPPHSIFQNLFSKKGKSKKKVHTLSHSAPPAPPPPPSSRVNQNKGNGSESPLIPIPPPPPPPPYKLPRWRYVSHYVRLESNNNSPRSGYSPSEDEDSSPNNQKPSTKSSLFCPSPDVNTKADDFIARFRAKLTLEKLNSIKQNQGTGPSPLGPDSTRS